MRPIALLVVLLVALARLALAEAPASQIPEVFAAVDRFYIFRYDEAKSLAAGLEAVGASPPRADRAAFARVARANVTAALQAYVESLGDPYTTYLSAEDRQALDAQLSGGSFTGIGVEVAPHRDGLRVVASLEDTPARRAGLRPGDVIRSVDGTRLKGLGYYRAADTLLGPIGAPVKLVLQDRAVTIKRETLRLPPVRAKLLDGGVGYVRIPIFGPDAAQRVVGAMLGLARSGASAFVLDLRDNPGGDLKAALDLAGQLAPGRLLLRIARKGGAQETRTAPGTPRGPPVRLAIIVNGGTASSAEVLAGALSDHKIATIVGEKTFGKGLIQTVVPLSGGAALKVTSGHYRTPSGTDIHGKGLQPQIPADTASDDCITRAAATLRE